MRIIGIGTDIVECVRIADMIQRHDEIFLTRVFTEREIGYCRSRRKATEHFAARFAAKEAVLKSLGTSPASSQTGPRLRSSTIRPTFRTSHSTVQPGNWRPASESAKFTSPYRIAARSRLPMPLPSPEQSRRSVLPTRSMPDVEQQLSCHLIRMAKRVGAKFHLFGRQVPSELSPRQASQLNRERQDTHELLLPNLLLLHVWIGAHRSVSRIDGAIRESNANYRVMPERRAVKSAAAIRSSGSAAGG